MFLCIFPTHNIVTHRCFDGLRICCKGYMDNKTDIESIQAEAYWISVEIYCGASEGNIGYLLTKE